MKRSILMLAFLASCAQPLPARDSGQWSEASPERSAWFESLMQPDTLSFTKPRSCCGDADAYEADLFEVDSAGDIIAIVTDGTGNDHGKITIPDGTRIMVPAKKVVTGDQAKTNPTGHGWVFVRFDEDGDSESVYCFVMGNVF